MLRITQFFFAVFFTLNVFAQPSHNITDDEKDFKAAKEFIAKGDYAFAYPLVKNLKLAYPPAQASNHTYLNDDIYYYRVLCELKLQQDIARNDALQYISEVTNESRTQLMSFHLAHYFFLKNDFENAVAYFDKAGYVNLSNEEIAGAKFEKAYSLFNLKRFADAKPLFNEIHQLPTNKYYLPANYYFGFISYYDRQYDEALTAFKIVETDNEYKGVVPYYIAEIYYFQNKRDEALRYGENAVASGQSLYYDKQLRLLLGQIYFERKEYSKALPLLEAYVDSSPAVSKEILYELSYCYYFNGNTSKAISGFKQLSGERDSMGQNSMYLLGDLYLKTGDKANARTAFQYSAFNSSNALQQKVSRFAYAKLSYELGYPDAALNEIKAYLRDYPSSEYDTEAKEILAFLFASSGNYSDGISTYESLKNPSPALRKLYPRLLYGRAVELINDGKPGEAGELLDKILSDNNASSTIPYANFWKGELAYREKRFDEAIRFLNSYLQANVPLQGEVNSRSAKYDLGYSYFQKENYRQAISFFEQVASGVSATSTSLEQDAYLRSADAYFVSRDFTKAGAMYDALINIASAQSDYATYQKAMIAGIKSSSEKIRILNSITRQYPQSTLKDEINLEAALTLIADEKFADAVPYLDRIVASENNALKPRAYQKLGLAYFNSNNNAAALKNYRALIEKYPQSDEAEEALDVIKEIYVSEGKTDEYLAMMKANGKEVSVSEADSLTYSTALIKYNSGDCAASIISLGDYLSKYPAGAYFTEASYLRSACYQKTKDWQNALAGYVQVSNAGNNKYFEAATLEAARINYLELKNYPEAKKYFQALLNNSGSAANRLEALRGLVRSYYMLKDYAQANVAAKELNANKAVSLDDKAIALLVLGKSQQVNNDCTAAIGNFKALSLLNKSAWGAEGRYEAANCYFTQSNFSAAEKAALSVIRETGSYDEWVTKSYILLGDIFMEQKDYFNAKATYESIAKNAAIAELKAEAQRKFEAAAAAEKSSSKISN